MSGTPKLSTDPQYTGKDCGCPVSKEGCIHPETGLECSGTATSNFFFYLFNYTFSGGGGPTIMMYKNVYV